MRERDENIHLAHPARQLVERHLCYLLEYTLIKLVDLPHISSAWIALQSDGQYFTQRKLNLFAVIALINLDVFNRFNLLNRGTGSDCDRQDDNSEQNNSRGYTLHLLMLSPRAPVPRPILVHNSLSYNEELSNLNDLCAS